MSQVKYYCLKCRRTNNCLCGTTEFRFTISPKLRVPSTKNKVKFRKFLDDCPQFPNCVPDELKPMFLELLREVKYFNKIINGYKWTYLEKK